MKPRAKWNFIWVLIVCFLPGSLLGQNQFNFSDFNTPSNLSLLGVAQANAGKLRLNPAAPGQNGTVYYATPVPLRGGFTTDFQFRISDVGGVNDADGNPGGDGFAFIIQKQSATFTTAAIGYIPYNIPDALVVEFDTWRNPDLGDPNGNHISLQSVGGVTNGSAEFNQSHSLGIASPVVNMSDGATHTVRIRYETNVLRLYLDNLSTALLTVTNLSLTNLAGRSAVDADGKAFVGFAGGTGGAFEAHEISSWSFQGSLPVIVTQPQGVTVKQCNSTTLSVTATGFGTLRYQWQYSGTPINGATNATYTLNSARSDQFGYYNVIVSNSFGSAISQLAFVVVDGSFAGSDSFTNATPLCDGPGNSYFVGGNAGNATGESGEPQHFFGVFPNHSLWWKWVAPSSGKFWVDTFGSSFDTVLAVYSSSGNSFASLSQQANANDSSFPQVPGDLTSYLTFSAVQGRTYYIAVDSADSFFASRVNLALLPVSGFVGVDLYVPQTVLTNGESLGLSATVSGVIDQNANVTFFDGNTVLFGRAQSGVRDVTVDYRWDRVPLGQHSVRATVTNQPSGSSSSTVVQVYPRPLGFARVANLVITAGTFVACDLFISNQTATVTDGLRVRLVLASTLQQRGSFVGSLQAQQDSVLNNFDVRLTNGLLPGAGWAVNVPANLQAQVPPFVNAFGSDGLQYHLDAFLEERLGTNWALVDRTRLYSSEPQLLFPPNEGVSGQPGQRNTNEVTYIESLALSGPASVNENATGDFQAQVTLSNSATNTVAPVWSVNAPFSISQSGRLSVGALAANATAVVKATYTRSVQTLVASKSIFVFDLSHPYQVAWPQPADIYSVAPLGPAQLNAVSSVPGTFSYQPPAGSVLNVGDQLLTATFTPDDLTTYQATNISVHINVLPVTFPIILNLPAKQIGLLHSNVQLTVQAAGTQPLRYQWQFNKSKARLARNPTATNDTLVLSNLKKSDAGKYRVIISNNDGSITSTDAVLTVVQPASILRQPVGKTIPAGRKYTFRVTPAGTAPFNFQWFRDNELIPGANSKTLVATNPGVYVVFVSNIGGAARSSNAVLQFLPPRTSALVAAPAPSAPVPRLWIERESGGAVTLTLRGEKGTQCLLEVSRDLLDWKPLKVLSLSDEAVVFHDPAAEAPRFYRTRVTP